MPAPANISILKLKPCCFDYYNFVLYFEVIYDNVKASPLFIFAQDCFAIPSLYYFMLI